MLNPNIILQGQQLNAIGALSAGQQAGQLQRQTGERNAMQDFMMGNGAQIRAGDEGALNALSNFGIDGLNAAQGVESNRLGMDNTRSTMQDREARLRMAQDQARQQAQTHAANMSAADREAEAAALERGLAMGTQAQSPEQWDQVMQSLGLADMVGQFDNKDMIIAGALGVKDALAMNAPATPQSPQGKLMADQNAGLVPQGTFEASGRTEADSAKEQQIARLMEGGVDRNTAIGIVDGRVAISRSEITGEVQLVDKATGQIVRPNQSEAGNGEGGATGSMPQGVDFSTATGGAGLGQQIANTLADAIGMGLPFENNEVATQAMNNLANQTMITLADGVAGRPSNFLLERFEQLTAKPNSVFQGEGRTRERLNQTRAMIAEGIDLNRDALRSDVSATVRSQAQQNINRLARLLREYDIVIESFGARQPQDGPSDLEDRLKAYE